MRYIVRERNSNEKIIIESSKTLNFFYGNFIGRLFLKILVTKSVSNLIGYYMNSFLSKSRIRRFVKKHDIDMSEYEEKKYKSYNDFFTRKINVSRRPINSDKKTFISPCDSKLSVYTINEDLTLKIKDAYYSIDSLVNGNIVSEYIGGYALVFRLSTDDYHRYCYIDSGSKENNYYIKGVFHTVQPISLKKYNFYKTNSREYTILNTDNFDKIVQVEVGAMGVGRICNHHKKYKFKKGEEKGCFEFGGSTIVLLVKKDVIDIDEDILNNSLENIETIVKYGEKIGSKSSYDTSI